VIANVGRGLLAVSMMMTYPMECYVSKHCMLSVLLSSHRSEDVPSGAHVTTILPDANSIKSTRHSGRIAGGSIIRKLPGGSRLRDLLNRNSNSSTLSTSYNVLPVFVIDDMPDDSTDSDHSFEPHYKPPHRAHKGGEPVIGSSSSAIVTNNPQHKMHLLELESSRDSTPIKSSRNNHGTASPSRMSLLNKPQLINTSHHQSRSSHEGDLQEVHLHTPRRADKVENSSRNSPTSSWYSGILGYMVGSPPAVESTSATGDAINNVPASPTAADDDGPLNGSDWQCGCGCCSWTVSRKEVYRVVVTLVLWIVVVSISISFSQVGPVLSLTGNTCYYIFFFLKYLSNRIMLLGAIGASFAGYIMPALIYFYSFESDFIEIWDTNVTPLWAQSSQLVEMQHVDSRIESGVDNNVEMQQLSRQSGAALLNISQEPSNTRQSNVVPADFSINQTAKPSSWLWQFILCILAFKQFYFCIFSCVFGSFLAVFGVYTVLYNYNSGRQP
jgi:hypothetical protein